MPQANCLRGYAFPKEARIRKRREFLRVKQVKNPAKLRIGPFLLIAVKNNGPSNRLGITITKKIGKSTVRNRLKRMAREFFRLRNPFWPQGLDLVFIARSLPPSPAGLFSFLGPGGEKKMLKAFHRILAG
ncbi:MAG: ribonuclease P protein component [Deltaproteobacteria bacterium]|jgi:ribonuclease P protein component|nr:ribonuclease P protein component [Deltaproteobacteria bacterium]